jgi:hypothetical protein
MKKGEQIYREGGVERIFKDEDARALRQHAAKKRNRCAERVVAEPAW